jgi:nitrate reductase NapE component
MHDGGTLVKPRSRLLLSSLVVLALVLWPLVASADECAAGGSSDTGAFQRYLA